MQGLVKHSIPMPWAATADPHQRLGQEARGSARGQQGQAAVAHASTGARCSSPAGQQPAAKQQRPQVKLPAMPARRKPAERAGAGDRTKHHTNGPMPLAPLNLKRIKRGNA